MIRKHNLKLFSAILLAAICTNASAAAGWTDFAPITEFNQQPVAGNASTYLIISASVTVNPSGCANSHGFYLDVNDDRRKRLFAMLLSAHLAGRSIKIYTTGNCHTLWGLAEMDGLLIN